MNELEQRILAALRADKRGTKEIFSSCLRTIAMEERQAAAEAKRKSVELARVLGTALVAKGISITQLASQLGIELEQ